MFWTASAFYQQLQVSYVGLCFIINFFFKVYSWEVFWIRDCLKVVVCLQDVTLSCRWSLQPRCIPAPSRRSWSWSWSTTWAPSKPCPPCRAPMQTGQRSATWATSPSRSKRPLRPLSVGRRDEMESWWCLIMMCLFVIWIPHMSSQNETPPLAIKWPRSLIYDQSGDNIKLFRNRWKGQRI